MLLHQRANHAINSNCRKLIFVSQPLSIKWEAKITLALSKHFPPEYNLLIREKNSLEQDSSILAWVKALCCLRSQVLHTKQPFSFDCNKYPHSLPMTRAMTAQWRKESHWIGRGYELHTPKSVGCEGSKAWALSVVPHFCLSPPRVTCSRMGWFHAHSSFTRSTIPKEKWGTTRSLRLIRSVSLKMLNVDHLIVNGDV